MHKFSFFILSTFFFLLFSCSSHRTLTHVTDEHLDSLASLTLDSLSLSSCVNTSSIQSTQDSTHTASASSSASTATETITETITETFDTLGIHTISTYRVIQRNTSHTSQSASDRLYVYEQSQSQNSSALTDSTSRHFTYSDEILYTKVDSQYIDEQKSSASPLPLSIWQGFKVLMIGAILAFLYIFIYIKHRKSSSL